MRTRQWHRKLWAVEFVGKHGSHMIGSTWGVVDPVIARADEPPRALLFCTRKAAREWVMSKSQEVRWDGAETVSWPRYRVVRVVESVRRV